jgi:pimeloyl-ACP methyl ester carboxylesterase
LPQFAYFCVVSENLQFVPSFIELPSGARLHLMRICADLQNPGTPVFMLHGSIENGRIFYSNSGKGFGPFLARAGYDVYVGDLRGRGASTPAIGKASDHGQAEAIAEEIPAFLSEIERLRGKTPIHLVAHSWGGVSLLAYLARPKVPVDVRSVVFFGTKRRITVRNRAYGWQIGVGWHVIARTSIALRGYVEAKGTHMGSDNITARTWRETNAWIYQKEWKHWQDGFDYRAALQAMKLPPILSFAGVKDKVLGHPGDVKLLLEELGPDQTVRYEMLSKQNCHLHDYGHIDMLTHPLAEEDHFLMAREWLRKYE